MNRDLAAWMARAGVPHEEIAAAFGVSVKRVRNALCSTGQRGRSKRPDRLAWCPPHARPLYRQLVVSKRMRAADARALVESDLQRRAS